MLIKIYAGSGTVGLNHKQGTHKHDTPLKKLMMFTPFTAF